MDKTAFLMVKFADGVDTLVDSSDCRVDLDNHQADVQMLQDWMVLHDYVRTKYQREVFCNRYSVHHLAYE